jgi:hypothetical protein
MSEFYTCREDEERLSFTSIQEAVEQWADDTFPDPLPETVTVYGYGRMKPKTCPTSPLDDMLERLDEEYGDPEGYHETPVTDAMREAERQFIAAVLAEYDPWACVKVSEEVVRVGEFLDDELLAEMGAARKEAGDGTE